MDHTHAHAVAELLDNGTEPAGAAHRGVLGPLKSNTPDRIRKQ